nr:reverse transcriptase domain-containing protein [Rickettsia endosymbiont of Ceutorhynchus assimilis]
MKTITFDTGAEVSIIKRTLVKSRAIQPLTRNLSLRTVTGESAAVQGEAMVELTFGSTTFRHRTLVADIEDDFILGMDLIGQHGFSFDPSMNILKFGNEEIVLTTQEESDAVKILATTPVRIPGSTEKIICGKLETNPGCCVGLTRNFIGDKPERILVGKTLVRTNGDIMIRIANVSSETVRIREGDIIGALEPVKQISNCDLPDKRHFVKSKLDTDTLMQTLAKSWKHLDPDRLQEATDFILKEADVFVMDNQTGRTSLIQHKIDTGLAHPIRQPPRRMPVAKQQEVENQIDKMLQEGIIEESNSPWSAPVVLVTKKDGSLRFCVDYRKLNDVTKKDSFPLPRIDDTLTTLSGSKWFSTLDLKSGYWQVAIHDDEKEKTAFSTGSGLYQFNVMPFGLCNAPATFERLMHLVLRGLTWRTCLVYLDDVMIMGNSFQEHLNNLKEVFDRFRNANLKLNPNKCFLFQKKVEFLGHVVSEEGIQVMEGKIDAVRDWPKPRDKHELRSFLGLCSYYRRFVEGFAKIAAPLHRLTEEKSTFNWTQECDSAFRKLKGALCTSPVLSYPDYKGMLILDTDASNISVGAVLSQIQNSQEHVVEYYSRTLSKPERNYCVTRRELLAIVKAVDHFHKYLYGRKFLIRTDHAALKWLLEMKTPEGQLARWIEKLQQYDFQIKHRPGNLHKNADALSRRPCKEDCKHCQRIDIHEKNTSPAVRRTGLIVDDKWTTKQMREDQEADQDIGQILHLKENDECRPEWREVSNKSLIYKALWAQWNSLAVENGLLKRVWESADGKSTKSQLVIPKDRVEDVLKEIHDGTSGAHFGVNKTLDKIRERFYWVHYHKDVKSWCRKCDICATSKGPKLRSRGPMKQYNVGPPFERIAIDVAGPFPESERGNKYILVIMNYFSKWPEVFAIPNQESITVAQVLVDEVFSRHGVPLELHSDQGRNFESAIFKKVCEIMGIRKTRTTPLHPQSDGMVERFNKTIEEHLTKVVAKNQRDWDKHLPLFLMAYRAAVHDSTGESPARIVFGRELRLPCDLMFGVPEEERREIRDYADEVRARLLGIHDFAREHIQLASDRMKTRYDLKANSVGFQEGDLVWLYNPVRKKEVSPKLSSAWEGPYRVIKRINDLVYRVQRNTRSKMKVVHLDRLAKYHRREVDRDDQP